MSEDSRTGTVPYGAKEFVGDIGWPAMLIFCAAFLGGLSVTVIFFKALGLSAIFGDEAHAISRDVLEPLLLIVLVMALARPRGARQLVWFGILTLLLSLYAHIASWFAGLAQVHAGPGRLYFISHSAFFLMLAPASAAVLFAMKRLAILPDRGGKPGLPHWIGIAIPGFLAAALVLDLLDAGGLMVADGEVVTWRLLGPATFGTLLAVQGVEPGRTGHWILLGSVIGALAMGGVTVFTLVERHLAAAGSLFTLEAPSFAVLMLQFAAIYIVKKATGPNGPWPEVTKWK